MASLTPNPTTQCLAIATRARRASFGSRRGVFHRAAVVTTAPNDVVVDATKAEVALLPRDLIGGDETIILAIKPSLWFAVFDSANWIAATLMIIVCSTWISRLLPGVSEPQLLSVVLAALGVRIGVALLRWVSRFYVLTNRRVMCIRGVLKPDVFECPLVNIRSTSITVSFHESFPLLGTLSFVISELPVRNAAWRNIAHPNDVHAEVEKAIRRALDCQPHL